MKPGAFKSALGASLKAESAAKAHVGQSLDEKVALAEALVTGKSKNKQSVPEVEKVVRDTFSIPVNDYALFERLMDRAMTLHLRTTKSTLLRAGLRHLMELSDARLKEVLAVVQPLKPGRRIRSAQG